MHAVVAATRNRFTYRLLLLLGILWPLPGIFGAEAAEPWFFIQLTDPQFGFCAKNADFRQETANFEFAIATANRLKPAFVIVTGDLVHKIGDKAQADEYMRIAARLDGSIPWHQLPGNHDVGNEPTRESIAAYTARFGPDHYAFRSGSLLGIVLNSNLIKAPQTAQQEADQQEAWLKAELKKANQDGVGQIVIFQHHPWFIASIDEPDAYDNLPRSQRRRYLDLFREHGVTHIFAGHYHANSVGRYESIEMVTTGAIGKPLRHDVSGFRVVIVRDSGMEHRFYHLGEIPNRIDLTPPKKAVPKADGGHAFIDRTGPLSVVGLSAPSRGAEPTVPLVTAQDAAGEIPGWKSYHETPGTKTGDVWRLRDGVLDCRGTPRGYLFTARDYTDFTLRLQWRWPAKPGRGGVLLRMTGVNKIWPKSLEAQLNVPDAGDLWGLDGFALEGPPERMKKLLHPQFGRLTNVKHTANLEEPAGQWNQYEIRAADETVVLLVNGQEVNRTRRCERGPGRICLTAEGDPIQFQHVELELK